MKTAIAVFGKTVGLSPVKTRLQKDLGKERTEAIYKEFCRCTRSVVTAVKAQFPNNIAMVWSVPEQSAVGVGLPEDWRGMWQGMGEGLGDKLDFVYTTLREEFDAVIMIGADAPHLPVLWISEAVKNLEAGSSFVLGPAADGGFYLFGGRKDVPADVWRSTPYSVETTCSVLRGQLQRLGSIGKDLMPLADVDTIHELKAMASFVANHKPLMLECQAQLAATVSTF